MKLIPWYVRRIAHTSLMRRGLKKAKQIEPEFLSDEVYKDAREHLMSLRPIGEQRNLVELSTIGDAEIEYDLSIIVPVYNGAEYLRECLVSLVQQTNYKYEIICIDDKSTDDSLQILKDFKCKVPFTILENEVNSGAGVTRNNGVLHSKGRYLLFVDCDDKLTDNTINLLMESAYRTGAEVVGQQFAAYNGRHVVQVSKPSPCEGVTEVKNISGISSLCVKCYDRTFYLKYPYLENCSFDDTSVWLNALLCCKRFTLIDHVGYLYRSMSNGVEQRDRRSMKVIDTLWAVEICLDRLDLKSVNKNELMKCLIIQGGRYLCQRTAQLDEALRKELVYCFSCILRRVQHELDFHDTSCLNEFYEMLYKALLTGCYNTWRALSSYDKI